MNYYTQNGWAGTKYQETKDLDITVIAKMVKKAIKAKYPDVKVSAKTDKYSMGQSLNVRITGKGLLNPKYDYNYKWEENCGRVERKENHKELTTYFTELGAEIETFAKAEGNQYRMDDSDGQIDYFCTNFYYFVQVKEQE